MVYSNRREAGRALGQTLARHARQRDVVVLALPRGGAPVGYEVARALGAPLDVWIVRKLGVPGHEELAMGAIAPQGVRVLDEDLIERLGIPLPAVDAVARREAEEMRRREVVYRRGRPHLEMTGKTAILVDDGLATGSTMRAAVLALRQLGPREIIVAVPVASEQACALLAEVADEVVCNATPEPFYGVGAWYRDFTQTTDQEVRNLLALADTASLATPPYD